MRTPTSVESDGRCGRRHGRPSVFWRWSCDLVIIVTELPADELPVANGMVQLDALGSGSAVDSVDSAVKPRAFARWLEQLPAEPGVEVRGDRVILCNGPGDYEAGRNAASLITADKTDDLDNGSQSPGARPD